RRAGSLRRHSGILRRLRTRPRTRGRGVTARHLRGLGDTNILIYLERLAAGQLPAELLISTVSLAELSAGVHSAEGAVERARRVMRVQRWKQPSARCRSTW